MAALELRTYQERVNVYFIHIPFSKEWTVGRPMGKQIRRKIKGTNPIQEKIVHMLKIIVNFISESQLA